MKMRKYVDVIGEEAPSKMKLLMNCVQLDGTKVPLSKTSTIDASKLFNIPEA